MAKDAGRWIALAAAFPIGALLGFFFVLAPLATDGPQSLFDQERLVSLALTVGAFVLAATLLAWASRGDRWVLLALGLPAIVIAAWYVLREPGVAELAAAYVFLVALALVSGRMVGLRLLRRREGADEGLDR